jgi:hypothetical protein
VLQEWSKSVKRIRWVAKALQVCYLTFPQLIVGRQVFAGTRVAAVSEWIGKISIVSNSRISGVSLL